jgi:L-histidine N-alpha-methyltransferase
VTAEFNLNVLRVLNRELDGDLPVSAFAHKAIWNAVDERIEMRLVADQPVRARLAAIDLDVRFEPGEELLTEISSKFRRAGITAELAGSGLRVSHWWADPQDYFAVSLSS